MLAPEEVFAPPSSSSLLARTELDPEEKRKARAKARKQKMHMRQGLDAAVDKYAGKGGGGGKARGGVRAEKDRALAELVKTGKGVSATCCSDFKRHKC
jgi:U3 small nucleolar RNA-associated protein MPP10